jgi:uncharacterized RDD family membrane protein YckC
MSDLAGGTAYAGFWRRFLAMIIDSIILDVALGLAAVVAFPLLGLSWDFDPEQMSSGTIAILYLVLLLVWWLYSALLESSSRQATVGKMAMSIIVTDMAGQRISFGRATGRTFGKVISSMIFAIGYIMAAFTARKQALHDIMAGCLVIRR